MNYEENFLKKAREIHGDKFDYSKVKYVDNKTPVCIICPEHGEFWQTPQSHLNNKGCKLCSFEEMGKEKRKNTEWFIEKAKEIHGDKYDYSETEYTQRRKKVTVKCPKHGNFTIIAGNHLKGSGCKKCAFEKISNLKKKDTKWFIEKAKEIHGNKYDYSKVEYVDSKTPVCIICPKHGEFWQMPGSHISGKSGCCECGKERIKMSLKKTTEDFIRKAKEVHGDRYDYTKTNYVGSLNNVLITCKKHGDFEQLASSHLCGSGCPLCADNQKLTKEEFIKRANNIHKNKYDYSKVDYKWNREKVAVICHDKFKDGTEHGVFMVTPHSHLMGSGCPKCKQNYRLENEVRTLLKENNIEFQEKPILEGLKYKLPLRPDFYIPSKHIMIECQGIQHFKPVNFGKNNEEIVKKQYELNKIRDNIKKKYCEENNIKLFEYSHLKIKGENLIQTKEELLEKILNNDTR